MSLRRIGGTRFGDALFRVILGSALLCAATGFDAVARSARAADDAPPAAPFLLESLSGDPLELSALLERGPVLLDFWATWCKPCVASLPGIQELHETYGPRGLTVIGVSIDGPRNFAKVRPFAARLGLTYPVALDRDGQVQRDYQISAVPSAALIDTSGALIFLQRGYRPGEHATLAQRVEALLPPNGSGAATPGRSDEGSSSDR